tara:strand:- start:410 stop:808 length:399 start_codon:yes stop_codon:yes gene_type:complete
MRKSTINLIVGIIIGIVISGISNSVSTDTLVPNNKSIATTVMAPVATTEPIESIFEKTEMASGLQIVKVPPPLDLNGRHPYQCYINGKSVKLPVELIEEIICEHGDPSESDPDFNVHNFTGNLKYVSSPFGE